MVAKKITLNVAKLLNSKVILRISNSIPFMLLFMLKLLRINRKISIPPVDPGLILKRHKDGYLLQSVRDLEMNS